LAHNGLGIHRNTCRSYIKIPSGLRDKKNGQLVHVRCLTVVNSGLVTTAASQFRERAGRTKVTELDQISARCYLTGARYRHLS